MCKKRIAVVFMIMMLLLQGTVIKAEAAEQTDTVEQADTAGQADIVAQADTETAELDGMIAKTVQGLKEISGSTKKYVLSDAEVFEAGSSICDWIAIALAFSGETDAYGDYLERLEAYVTDSYKEKGGLDEVAATPYQRCVLTILALGGEPQAFGKDAEGNPINMLSEGTYYFKGDSLGAQGITGHIYALLALDTKNYQLPEDAVYTRETMIRSILENQSEDGGFSLSGNGNDVDITAMALQALAPYKEQQEVNTAIEKALEWLSGEMTQYGTFVSGTSETCESTAQVIQAMCALELEVTGDERFQKNGMTPWEGMQQFRLEDGTYVHTLEEQNGNLIATEQALLALEAMQVRESQERWLLDYSTYELSKEQCADENSGMPVVIVEIVILVVLMAGISVVIVRKKKGKRNENA